MEDELSPLPPDAPERLKKTWEAAKHFLALGRAEQHAAANQQWSLEEKRRLWADLITRKGSYLDSMSEEHPWHDPASDRLQIMVERLAAEGYNRLS